MLIEVIRINDPHVNALYYKLVVGNATKYENPQPIEEETDAFYVRLENDDLKATMKVHFASDNDARGIVGKYLRSWEAQALLAYGAEVIRFEFERAEIIDRNPTSGFAAGGSTAVLTVKATADGIVTSSYYPTPPKDFKVNDNIETMLFRYARYKEGREPLLSMANFCLTVLEQSINLQQGRTIDRRRKVSAKYKIGFGILNKLGKLAALHGDEKEARKGKQQGNYRPLTDNERIWIEAVVRMIILRAGEIEACGSAGLRNITKQDLPNIT